MIIESNAIEQSIKLFNIDNISIYICPFVCPCGNCRSEWCGNRGRLINMVAHLNDRHGMTFIQIADWLDAAHIQ